MFAATSLVGVKPTVRANAGRVRCRATASAAVAPAGLSGMTGFRRASSIDTLGRGIGAKKTFNGAVAQTLGLACRSGRGRRFVTKAMFEVRPRETRANRPLDRSNPKLTRSHRTLGVGTLIARVNPRVRPRRARRRDAEATPVEPPRREKKPARNRQTHGSDLLHPSPASPSPTALHREGHQGCHAGPGGGPPSRPQLRRHRAGESAPRRPSRGPLSRWIGCPLRESEDLALGLGQRCLPVRAGPPSEAIQSSVAHTRPLLSFQRRSCSVSSARAPASPPRCSRAWVSTPAPLFSPHFAATSLIRCRELTKKFVLQTR